MTFNKAVIKKLCNIYNKEPILYQAYVEFHITHLTNMQRKKFICRVRTLSYKKLLSILIYNTHTHTHNLHTEKGVNLELWVLLCQDSGYICYAFLWNESKNWDALLPHVVAYSLYINIIANPYNSVERIVRHLVLIFMKISYLRLHNIMSDVVQLDTRS